MAAGAGNTRVSDAERREVVDRLAEAHGEGRLGLAEFEERAGAAHAAVVRSDLAPLTEDLPIGRAAPPEADRGPAARPGLRGAVGVWAVVSAINLVIWMAVSVGVGDPVHPWWIWVAGPWGAMLALHATAGRALPHPPLSPFVLCGRR